MKDNLTDLCHQLDSLQEDFHSLIPELVQVVREVEKPPTTDCSTRLMATVITLLQIPVDRNL